MHTFVIEQDTDDTGVRVDDGKMESSPSTRVLRDVKLLWRS